jgi:streptomycin 6-kinase
MIHSALILGLAGGSAILKVVKHDSTRDGSQACADLIEWYEGQGSLEAIAKCAMEMLQMLQLTQGTRYMEQMAA